MNPPTGPAALVPVNESSGSPTHEPPVVLNVESGSQ